MSAEWKRDFNSCGNGAHCTTFTEPQCLQDKSNANCVSFHESKCLARGPATDSSCGVTGTLIQYNAPPERNNQTKNIFW